MDGLLGIIFAIVGGLLAFGAIGWIIIQRFYKHAKVYEKIIYSITLSISVTIIIGLLLSYLKVFNLISLVISYAALAIIVVVVSFIIQ